MFTGIVQDLGKVAALTLGADGSGRLEVQWGAKRRVARGESVAVNGACLTVLEDGEGRMAFDLSPETLAKTTLGALKPGSGVNLERALRAGEALGGHLMAGHVDGVAKVISLHPQGEGCEMAFEAPAALAPYLADKGSVAVDGVSLTPYGVQGSVFKAALIPHTLAATTLGELKPGDKVNLEVDLLARYVARQLGLRAEGR